MHMSTMEGSEYPLSASAEEELGEPFGYMNMNTTRATSRKKRSKNMRRFSDEQIRSLETMFENETRLEPRKKVQLARDLGLQPRQVAIWFQNKRARYKSKQLERDYGVLRANYNNLASRFDNLNAEKQALLIQLQKLNGLMHNSELQGRCREQDLGGHSIDGESDNGDANKLEFEEKPSLLSRERSERGIGVVSDDDNSLKADHYFGMEEEPNLLELVEPADSSLTSAEDWGNFDSDGLFNQSSTSYQWWDFWS